MDGWINVWLGCSLAFNYCRLLACNVYWAIKYLECQFAFNNTNGNDFLVFPAAYGQRSIHFVYPFSSIFGLFFSDFFPPQMLFYCFSLFLFLLVVCFIFPFVYFFCKIELVFETLSCPLTDLLHWCVCYFCCSCCCLIRELALIRKPQT